ncbi:MAG: helix-turn-helix transcriptional regulator [Spirochaetales bacterium]|nr:helix-turn-helix transcriptional regulator [Spirochaetales bacterium]
MSLKEQDTKKRILEEASRLFADKGYDDTGIDLIAKSVGITKSVIYYYFKGKEEILKTLLNSFYNELLQMKKDRINSFLKEQNKDHSAIAKAVMTSLGNITDFHKRILRIIFMESLKKKKSESNLFKIESILFEMVFSKYGEHINENIEQESPAFFMETFFMFFLPSIAFIILGDDLAEYLHIDENNLKGLFTNMISEYYNNIIFKKFWKE